MTRSGWFLGVSIIGMALAGCGHRTPGSSTAAPAAAVAATGPVRPAASADQTTWGNYLAAQGKIHGKDVGMRPYIYVIPGGDSVAATTRREQESDSIRHTVGHILIPGGLLILGGPDGPQTGRFIAGFTQAMKPDTLKGIVVLVVGDAAQETAVTRALKPTGATIRFVVM